MNCRDAREAILERLSGEAHAPALDAHLAACAACSAERTALAAVTGGLAGLPLEPAPAGFADAVMAGIGTPAAAASGTSWSWKSLALGGAAAGAVAVAALTTVLPPEGTPPPVPPVSGVLAPDTAGPGSREDLAAGASAGSTEAVAASTASTQATSAGASESSGSAPRPLSGQTAAAAESRPSGQDSRPTGDRAGPRLGGPRTAPATNAREGEPIQGGTGAASLDNPLDPDG